MSADTPIARCCAKPRFNAVGGIDERFWPDQLGTALRRKMRSIAGDRAAAERVEPLQPETGVCIARPRLMRIIAAVDRHYRVLTPVARRMQMPNNRARPGCGCES